MLSILYVLGVAPKRGVEYWLRTSQRQSMQRTAKTAMIGEIYPSTQRSEYVTPNNEACTKVISAPRRVEQGIQVAEATPNPTSTYHHRPSYATRGAATLPDVAHLPPQGLPLGNPPPPPSPPLQPKLSSTFPSLPSPISFPSLPL